MQKKILVWAKKVTQNQSFWRVCVGSLPLSSTCSITGCPLEQGHFLVIDLPLTGSARQWLAFKQWCINLIQKKTRGVCRGIAMIINSNFLHYQEVHASVDLLFCNQMYFVSGWYFGHFWLDTKIWKLQLKTQVAIRHIIFQIPAISQVVLCLMKH